MPGSVAKWRFPDTPMWARDPTIRRESPGIYDLSVHQKCTRLACYGVVDIEVV